MSEPQKIASQTETTQEPGSRILAMLDVMLDMRFSDDITISPDGKRVAFVVWERVPDEPKRRGRIWVSETSGRWSDPGRGSGEIFTVSLESRQTRNLTPGIALSTTWCCWFPDSHHLLYAACKDVTHQISIIDSSNAPLIRLNSLPAPYRAAQQAG